MITESDITNEIHRQYKKNGFWYAIKLDQTYEKIAKNGNDQNDLRVFYSKMMGSE